MPATYAANKAAIWQLTPPPPPPKQTNIKRQLKYAPNSAPGAHSKIKRQICWGVYLQKYSERNKYKTLDRLHSPLPPVLPALCPSPLCPLFMCVCLSIKIFGISISILDIRQRLHSAWAPVGCCFEGRCSSPPLS